MPNLKFLMTIYHQEPLPFYLEGNELVRKVYNMDVSSSTRVLRRVTNALVKPCIPTYSHDEKFHLQQKSKTLLQNIP